MYNPGMFNFEHLMYMAVSGLLTVVMLVLFRRYARTEQEKNKILQLIYLLKIKTLPFLTLMIYL